MVGTGRDGQVGIGGDRYGQVGKWELVETDTHINDTLQRGTLLLTK